MNFFNKKLNLNNIDMDAVEKYIYKIIKTLMVFILFFNIYIIQTIPLVIYNIPIQSLSGEMQIILTSFSSATLLLILFLIYRKDLIEEWEIFKKNLANNLNDGISYWLIGLIIMLVSNIIISQLLNAGQPGNEQAVQSMINTLPWLMLISAGFLAPITEEIVFRKSIKDVIKDKYLYIMVSFVLFGLAHVLGNANSLVDWLFIIPYGALGASFAAAYCKTNTIFVPISMHMFHNTLLTLISILL